MGLPLNLEDIDKWTNPYSYIGDVREFVSLPGACAILNEEKLKELIEELIQNLTQTMRSICREFISHERIGGFVYAPRYYKPKNEFGRQYGYNENGQVKTLQMAWGAPLYTSINCARSTRILIVKMM